MAWKNTPRRIMGNRPQPFPSDPLQSHGVPDEGIERRRPFARAWRPGHALGLRPKGSSRRNSDANLEPCHGGNDHCGMGILQKCWETAQNVDIFSTDCLLSAADLYSCFGTKYLGNFPREPARNPACEWHGFFHHQQSQKTQRNDFPKPPECPWSLGMI